MMKNNEKIIYDNFVERIIEDAKENDELEDLVGCLFEIVEDSNSRKEYVRLLLFLNRLFGTIQQ